MNRRRNDDSRPARGPTLFSAAIRVGSVRWKLKRLEASRGRVLRCLVAAGAASTCLAGAADATAKDPESDQRPRPLFGYNDAFENGYQPQLIKPMVRAAIAGGAEVVRFPLSFCRVAENTAPGQEETPLAKEQWDWSGTRRSHYAPANYDQLFELVRRRNANANPDDDIRVIAELLDSPAWANSRLEGQPDAGGCSARPLRDPATGETVRDESGAAIEESAIAVPPSEDRLQDWRTFVAEVARRWGGRNYGIAAIEVWNEPNLPPFWGSIESSKTFGGDPRRYARLFTATAVEVGRKFPVVFGGLAGGAPNADPFLRRALASIRRKHLDGIGVHLYARHSRWRAAKRDLLRQWRLVAVAGNRAWRRGRPVTWITEVGFPLRSAGGGDVSAKHLRRQCRRLTWAYDTFVEKRPGAFIVHSLVDLPHETRLFGVGAITGSDHRFTPRPSYRGLARLQRDRTDRCG